MYIKNINRLDLICWFDFKLEQIFTIATAADKKTQK